MITVKEAFSILENSISPPQEVNYSLWEARNHVLAQTLVSPISMPPFRQSAMDGFALHIHDCLSYEIIGEIKAGDMHKVTLLPGQATKIFTGAAVPDSANAVIQIEKVSVIDNILTVPEQPKISTNIRPIGEQISKDAIALEKGTILNAAAIGFLAGLGFTTVPIFKKPTIGIVVTGNELTKPGNPLEYGKIYESNSIMLQTALIENQYQEISIYEVNDDFINTKNTLAEALNSNDVVLVSGGISVGDYDFVARALNELQVETLFYKVNQKPGKPIFAGKLNNKMIFALPGNPAACLTCFYVYVVPTLALISGKATDFNQTKSVSLTHDYVVNNTRSQFLKARVENNQVRLLTHQQSSMLNTFSIANALLFVPEGNYELKKDVLVDIYHI